jgi:ATP-dependent DNA helicase RecG
MLCIVVQITYFNEEGEIERRMHMESQTEEWKESWRADYLNTLCAFANTDGGTMFIGKNNKGDVVGVRNHKKLLEEIPNSVYNKLNFHPVVKEVTENGKIMVTVNIEPQKEAIFLDGCVHIRSGSTTVKLAGSQLIEFLLKKSGRSWTDISTDEVKMNELSQEAIDFFVKKGMESGRMSPAAKGNSNESLLRYYKLMGDDGLRRSGAILFLEYPGMTFHSPTIKIGAFTGDGTMLRHDKIDCPVIMQPDKVMGVLLDKYIQGVDEVERLMMVRKYPYPVKALRESVMNAITHRDYSSVAETYIKVFPDRVVVSNPGKLPDGWTTDRLLKEHESKSPNPNIAHAFYDIGYNEKWGRGIEMIRKECEAMGIPMPIYTAENGRIAVMFKEAPKAIGPLTKAGTSDLTDTESKIYSAVCMGNMSTTAEISEASGVPFKTAERVIAKLVRNGYIQKTGGRRQGKWVPVK